MTCTKNGVFAKNPVPDFSITIAKTGYYENRGSSVFRSFSHFLRNFGRIPGTGKANRIGTGHGLRRALLDQSCPTRKDAATPDTFRRALSAKASRGKMLEPGNILARIGVEYLRDFTNRRG
jgi:hypothetical protein